MIWNSGVDYVSTSGGWYRPKAAAVGGANVSVNRIGTYHYFASSTSVNYTGLNVAAGTNTVLIATIVIDSGGTSPTNMTATWDSGGTNQAMTFISRAGWASSGSSSRIYGLVSPTVGNKTLTVSWTTSVPVFVCASAFDNVDQGGGALSFENPNGRVIAALGVASHSTDMAIAAAGGGSAITGILGTTIYSDSTSGTTVNTFSDYIIGASPTVSLGHGGGAFTIAGVNLKQFGRAAVNNLSLVSAGTPLSFSGTGGGQALSFAVTGTDDGRALLFLVCFGSANAGTTSGVTASFTYTTGPSQSLQQIGGPYSNGTVGDIYIFGLTGPMVNDTAGGISQLALSWTGTNAARVYPFYIKGADQTGGSTTFHNVVTNTGTGSVPTVTTTVPSGEFCAACFLSTANFTTVSSGTDNTHDNTMSNWAVASAYTTSSGSQTLAYNPAGTFIAVSVCVKSG
jgi:hypothetical protein